MTYTPRSDRATTRKPETAPPRIATWTASTRLRRAAAAVRTLALTAMNMPMMPEAIEQAAPTRKAMPVRMPRSTPLTGVSATCLGLDDADDDPGDHDRADEGEDADRRVLAADEGDRALVDRPGDVLHLLGAGVPGQDVTGEVDREQDGDQPAGRMISWSGLASIGVFDSSCQGHGIGGRGADLGALGSGHGANRAAYHCDLPDRGGVSSRPVHGGQTQRPARGATGVGCRRG